MNTDGTFRFIQNIAGWTARPENHVKIDWRPKAINHTINENVEWKDFEDKNNESN